MGRNADELEMLLAEQVAYYRARAPEYQRTAMLDLSDQEISDVGHQVMAALEAFNPAGDVLELACGPGTWTLQLRRFATSVTAVDASPEMLALAAQNTGGGVRFVEANLFDWHPDRRYDAVFFGFWLSHVPLERFESFWAMVGECLKPDGRVFFVDDGYWTADELIEGEASATILRRLSDGTPHRAVKVPHRPAELEHRLARLGWQVTVTAVAGPIFFGAGHPR